MVEPRYGVTAYPAGLGPRWTGNTVGLAILGDVEEVVERVYVAVVGDVRLGDDAWIRDAGDEECGVSSDGDKQGGDSFILLEGREYVNILSVTLIDISERKIKRGDMFKIKTLRKKNLSNK
eukprot:gb/GECH01010127.1/.p1 GENE.gb/GECH01010127.1/~~gb/GECH01010127.1/.p1  ORF type:complete len:121 (+),score=7.24 gb/GECH01010127.1/:1-363(+)